MFDIFTALNIEIHDVFLSNVIMDREKIILIDPDEFRINESVMVGHGEYALSLKHKFILRFIARTTNIFIYQFSQNDFI